MHTVAIETSMGTIYLRTIMFRTLFTPELYPLVFRIWGFMHNRSWSELGVTDPFRHVDTYKNLETRLHGLYLRIRMNFLQKLCSFFRRREVPQPSATPSTSSNPVSNTISPPGSAVEQQIGIFNGTQTVIIIGGTFIIVGAGERVFSPIEQGSNT